MTFHFDDHICFPSSEAIDLKSYMKNGGFKTFANDIDREDLFQGLIQSEIDLKMPGVWDRPLVVVQKIMMKANKSIYVLGEQLIPGDDILWNLSQFSAPIIMEGLLLFCHSFGIESVTILQREGDSHLKKCILEEGPKALASNQKDILKGIKFDFISPESDQHPILSKDELDTNDPILDLEFFAHFVWMARFGSEPYKRLGKGGHVGTTLFGISNNFESFRFLEVPSGLSLKDALHYHQLDEGFSDPQSLLIPGGILGKAIDFNSRENFVLSNKRTSFVFLKKASLLTEYLEKLRSTYFKKWKKASHFLSLLISLKASSKISTQAKMNVAASYFGGVSENGLIQGFSDFFLNTEDRP